MNYRLMQSGASAYALAFQAKDITSTAMREAIMMWFSLYYQKHSTPKEDPCQQIPYTIVRKLTKTTFSEYKADSKNDFARSVLAALDAKKAEALQLCLIGGESKLKPVPMADGFRFVTVPRYNIMVFGRDGEGNMTDIGTIEQTAVDKFYYTLLERRTVDANGYLTIRNKLFRSYVSNELGQEVPLTSLAQYEQLLPIYTYPQPVGSVGLVSLKLPMLNCVDGSADAVSVYAAAVGLIQNINRNEAQLNGEFERGESRIIVSADMLKEDERGRKKLDDTIFVGLDEDQESVGITAFSPALREASFLARKQEYLRNVENVIGLKRGLLSEVEAAERTATEITSSAGEYNLTIIDLQQMWENTVVEAVHLCGILGKMYHVPGVQEVPADAISFDWGNGVLYDEEKTYKEMKEQVAAKLLQPERLLGWYYDRPCDTPAQREKIRKDFMPDVGIEEDE